MATVCTTSGCGTGGWNGPLPGDPDNSSLLSTTSEFGGIRVTWTLPNTNAYAVAYTKLYRSIGDDFATAIPYKFVAGNEYFDAQAGEVIRSYYYWIQHVSVNGTELSPIGPVVNTAKPLLEQVLADLQGRVEFSTLSEDLRTKIDQITDLQNGLTQLNSTVLSENSVVSQQLLALQNELDDTLAYIDQQQVIEANERQAFVQAVNTQLAAVGDNAELYAAIEEEATTRAQETGELFAQKVLKVDLAGNISGYGLAASVDPDGNATSEFQVRADTFSIAPPALVSNTAPANPYNGMVWEDTSTSPATVRWYNSTAAAWQTTPVKSAVPFIVKTEPELVDGYLLEPGVYINTAFIGRISANQIDTRGLAIRDDEGNVIFSSGSTLDWSRIGGFGKPQSGATRNVFRQNWAINTVYFVGDIVLDGEGYGWTCAQDHTSSPSITPPAYPTESNAYWDLFIVKGEPGLPGPAGADGTTLYTWVKYADSPTSGMSDYSDGKAYIGIAYNKASPTESTNYADYSWSKIQGDPGIPGPPGEDGATFTWIKYADSDTGGGMSDSPAGKRYIGLAVNKDTATESTNPADYSWSLIALGATFNTGQVNTIEGKITSGNANTFIDNAAIGAAQIGSVSLTGEGKFNVKTALSGQRIEMDSRFIKVFDENGALRVHIGDLLA